MSAKRSASKNGNAVIIALVAAGLGLASIFTIWGTAILSEDDVSREIGGKSLLGGLLAAIAAGMRLEVNGTSSFRIFGVETPMWIFSAIVIAGAGIAAANLAKYASLPKLLPQVLCGIGVAISSYLMIAVLDGGLGIGIILLLAGSGLGLVASLKKA